MYWFVLACIDLFIWKRFATGVWNILMLTPAIANYGCHDKAAPADGTLEETGLHVKDLEHPFEPLSASSWLAPNQQICQRTRMEKRAWKAWSQIIVWTAGLVWIFRSAKQTVGACLLHTCRFTFEKRTCLSKCMYVSIHACIYIYVCVYIYMHIMLANMCVCACVCTYTYIYMYIMRIVYIYI